MRKIVGPPAAHAMMAYEKIGVRWAILRICNTISARIGIRPTANQLNTIML